MTPQQFNKEFGGDPVKCYFSGLSRQVQGNYLPAAAILLQNKFKYHSVREIEAEFDQARFLYAPAYQKLKQKMESGGRTRSSVRRNQFEVLGRTLR